MRLFSVLAITLITATTLLAGPKGTVLVEYLPPGTVTIDGDFSDWPLDSFTTPAQQPLFPAGRDADFTDAAGDHIVWEPDRVGYFNGSAPTDFTSAEDFGAWHYFSHDSEFMYMLSIVMDDVPLGDQDMTEFGSSGFLNDGFEIFLDAAGDSGDDRVDEDAFPAFDMRAPNFDDLQLTVGLNDNFLPDDAPANAIGVREGIERAGVVELFSGEDGQKNAPGSLYRDIVDSEQVSPSIAAQLHEEIPNTQFSGYAIEMKMPFGFIPEFVPSNTMGFDIFWRDFDNDNAPGGAGIIWMDWAQNTSVPSDDSGAGLFHGSNWGQLVFAPETAGADCDVNADGSCDVADLDVMVADIAGGSPDAALDLNGDGSVNSDDIREWLVLGGEENGLAGPYLFGDADLSGKVDAGDLNAMALNWQQDHTTWQGGDFDASGFVDAGDLNGIALNWEQQVGAAANAAVPEPSSSVLLLVGLFGIARRKRA